MSPRIPDIRLIEVCPEYRAALEAFREACNCGDLELASSHWNRAGRAARDFRARVSETVGAA